MNRFYIGLHQPSDAHHFTRCCIHIGRLLTRVKPLGCDELLIDSQAFRVLELFGNHRLSPLAYALHAERIARLCGHVVLVAQDYMCEDYIFAKRLEHTGVHFTVADHQRLTIARYDALHYHASTRNLSVMPVLQGYSPNEYLSHIAQYGSRLLPGMWVGVGSVCKRNGDPSAIRDVLYTISRARPDLRLHGFGVKRTALSSAIVRDYLYSADSMAWSFAARREGRNANSYHEAMAYDRIISGGIDDLPMFRGAA